MYCTIKTPRPIFNQIKTEKCDEITHTHTQAHIHIYTHTEEEAGIVETYMLWFLQESPIPALVVVVH